jgi:hypothetical protein
MPLFDMAYHVITLSQLCMTVAVEVRKAPHSTTPDVDKLMKSLFTEAREICEHLGYIHYFATSPAHNHELEFYCSQDHLEKLLDQTLVGCGLVFSILRHGIESPKPLESKATSLKGLLEHVKAERMTLSMLKDLMKT